MSLVDDAQVALAAGLGVEIPAEEGFGPATLDVPAARWAAAMSTVRTEVGCEYFDWLSAVDEGEEGFAVFAHLARLGPGVEHLLLRTRVSRSAAVLPSVIAVFPGAAWHERETHEMFGVEFDGNPDLTPLLLPDEFEGHPLRKDFVLASRVAKPWPGAKEPGESDAASRRAPARRRMAPPGVPSPEEWGPRPPADPDDTPGGSEAGESSEAEGGSS